MVQLMKAEYCLEDISNVHMSNHHTLSFGENHLGRVNTSMQWTCVTSLEDKTS